LTLIAPWHGIFKELDNIFGVGFPCDANILSKTWQKNSAMIIAVKFQSNKNYSTFTLVDDYDQLGATALVGYL